MSIGQIAHLKLDCPHCGGSDVTLKDLKCPACAADDLQIIGAKGAEARVWIGTLLIGWLLYRWFYAGTIKAGWPIRYKCKKCGHKFIGEPTKAQEDEMLPAPCMIRFERTSSIFGAWVPQIVHLNGVKVGPVKNGKSIVFPTCVKHNVIFVTDQYGMAFRDRYAFEAQPGASLMLRFNRKFTQATVDTKDSGISQREVNEAQPPLPPQPAPAPVRHIPPPLPMHARDIPALPPSPRWSLQGRDPDTARDYNFEWDEHTTPAPTLGRSSSDSDFRVENDTVSRQHARFRCVGGNLLLTDLHSSNGTRKNGVPLTPGQEVLVTDGSILTFGNLSLSLRRK